MPGYVIPEHIMAMTPEQMAQCTLGTASVIPGMTNHNRSLSKFPVQMVESDSQAKIIQNLVGYPAAVEQYKTVPTDNFIKEDPTLLDPKALEPLSGRK